MDWNKYPNFSAKEFQCSHCGEEFMREEFIKMLQALRTEYGLPMTITSGYRCQHHPIEAAKHFPGAHSMGIAADVSVSGADAYRLVKMAMKLGFTGVGVQQRGAGRFVHLDIRNGEFPTPSIWSY